MTFDIHAQLGDIIRHGIYSINILSVILLVLGIIGSGVAAVRLLTRPDVIGSLLGMAGAAVVAVSIIVSSLWDTLKDFIAIMISGPEERATESTYATAF